MIGIDDGDKDAKVFPLLLSSDFALLPMIYFIFSPKILSINTKNLHY